MARIRFGNWLGIEVDEVSWKEKLISVAGGAVALFAIFGISKHLLGGAGANMLVASMGASAVLIFAVPHGQLSQPWPVLAGHAGSALIGVACADLIPTTEVAAACAVGLAIGVMHQFKCIHPPGGATALTAVVAGPAVAKLGYSFVLRPVLLNAVTIVLVGVLFNAPFRWRRYPAALRSRPAPAADWSEPTHERVLAALRSLDSFVDISEDDLLRLVRLLAPTPGGPPPIPGTPPS
jgi:CBS-domain-containing membrane protein